MKSENNRLIGGIIAFALAIVILTSVTNAETIDDNKVYIDDARLYYSAEPHTIKTGDDQINFQLMSKVFSGEIDIAFGFDTDIIKPKSAEAFIGGEWRDVTSSFDRTLHDYGGMNSWYFTTGININAMQIYDFRVNFNIINKGSGKYWACIKPSSQTIGEAILSNNFLCLDPWFDIQYSFKNKIWGNISALSQNTTGLIPINITLNTSQLFWCNLTVSNVNNTIGYVYWNDDNNFVCVNADETSNVTTIIDESNGQDYGTKPSDLVLFLPFGDCTSTTCQDHSMYNNDAFKTLSGTPYNVTGINGFAQECSGTRLQGMYVNDADSIQFRDGDNWTTSIWIKPDSPVEIYQSVYDKGDNYNLFLLNSRQLTTQYWYASSSSVITDTPVIINYNNWYHLVNVFDRQTNTITIYVNGQNVTNSQSYSSTSRTLTNELRICYNYGTLGLNGAIDNFMVFDRAFSGDEVNLTYHSQLTPFPYGSQQTSTELSPKIPIEIPSVYPEQTCLSDEVLVIRVVENKTVNGVSNLTVTDTFEYCSDGCGEFISGDACLLSDFQISMIAIPIVMIGAFVIMYFPRFVKKKKKHRF